MFSTRYLLPLFLLVFATSCKKGETPPEELKDTDVNGDACIAARCYVDYHSLLGLYPEDCPSCKYEWEVTNGAEIVAGQNTNGVRVRAGEQSFQVKAKITYDGGETNTVTKNVLVEAQDAVGALDEITLDYPIEVVGAFTYNGDGYAIALSFSDLRMFRYEPISDSWILVKAQAPAVIANRASKPMLLGTDEIYYNDCLGNLYKYDFSDNLFTNLGTVPEYNAAINYVYNGKYFSGSTSSNDTIYQYDPITAQWSFAYTVSPMVASGNGAKYTYPLTDKAYIYLNTGGALKLDYASQTFTAISAMGYNMNNTAIMEMYGNLHVINGQGPSGQYIIDIAADQPNVYTPFINTCGTTGNGLVTTSFNYLSFGLNNKGIIIDHAGNVFHFNPGY